jgi:hypothetical protein
MGLGSGIRDLGSGKNLFRIPDPGVKKALDPGSGSATLYLTLFLATPYELVGKVPVISNFKDIYVEE